MPDPQTTTPLPLYDREGKRAGYVEIPCEIIASAARVYHWMKKQTDPYAMQLYGLRLSEEDEKYDRI